MAHRSRTASSVTGYPRTAPKVAWTWTASWANGGIASSVIASTDKAFVIVDRASESSSAYLVALSPTTGSMLWQSDLMFPMGASNYYTTTHPTVSADGTMVFVNVASNLTAYSASTGARLYSVIVCPFGQLASTAPLVTGNMVLSSCRDWARITANNPTSGAELWTQSVFGPSNSIYGPPALISYNFRTLVAFATIGGAISAYDILSGSQVISMNSADGGVQVSSGQARSATIVANSGSVVYSAFDAVSWSSSSPWAIVGVDVSTGQTTMRAKTPGDGYIGRGSMALGANNVLYTYVNEGARVAAVSTTANNSVLWTYRLNDQVGYRAIYSSPLVSPDGSVFVRDDQAPDGGAKLYLLDGNTGAQLWNYTLPGAAIRNSPVIAHGGLYVGGSGSVVKLVDIAATVTPAPSASPSKMPSPSMAASMSPAAASPSQAPPSGAPLPFVAKVSTTIRINGLASTMVPFAGSLSMNLYVSATEQWASACVLSMKVHGLCSGFGLTLSSAGVGQQAGFPPSSYLFCFSCFHAVIALFLTPESVPLTSACPAACLQDALNDDLLAFRYAAVPTTLYDYFDYFSVGFITYSDPTPYCESASGNGV